MKVSKRVLTKLYFALVGGTLALAPTLVALAGGGGGSNSD